MNKLFSFGVSNNLGNQNSSCQLDKNEANAKESTLRKLFPYVIGLLLNAPFLSGVIIPHNSLEILKYLGVFIGFCILVLFSVQNEKLFASKEDRVQYVKQKMFPALWHF